MLLVNVEKLGNWHAHLVRAPYQVRFVFLQVVLDALRSLVVADVLADWVGDLRECLLILTEDELFLLDFDLIGFVHLARRDDNRLG